MPRRPRKIKVIETKLGRVGKHGAYGRASVFYNTIEIDPRMTERKRIAILVHEALHIADWEMPEKKVDIISKKIGKVLWDQGYRRPRQ